MITVTIDDALAARLRTLRGGENAANVPLEALVAEALAETARRWEREAQGRAEFQAMLDGPRHTPAEAEAKTRQKYGYSDLSHLTDDELLDQAEATLAALPPEKVAEARRLGLL